MTDSVTFPVDPVHIMLFARAVNDDNPIYRDAAYAATTPVGEIIAPPTFTQALQQFIPRYPWRPVPGEPWVGSGSTPSGAPRESGTVLHAEQHFEYHRAVRAHDVLTATTREGERWEKTSRNGGLLKFREVITEFRDAAGELVVTSRAVEVETGRPSS